MVEINHREHYIRAKILYYGPAAGGKTTNLQALHRRARREKKLELVSVNTAQDRTILFDLLPLSTPAFRSYELRFQIVAVPGQRLYAATRKMLVKNADAVVFVANSASDRWEENLQSMKELTEYLLGHGIEPSNVPIIFQYNKRDLPNTTDIEKMDRGLNARQSDSFPAIAIHEQGVLESFAAALGRTMTELSTRYNIGESMASPRSAAEWTDRTMRETFAVDGLPQKRHELRELEPEPMIRPVPSPPPMIVRVRTPSQPRLYPPSEKEQGKPPSPPPVPGEATSNAPSAAAELQDPRATQSLIESYAEAASGLGDHISRLREEKDEAMRWLEELSAVADLTRDLLGGPGADLESPLRTLVTRMAQNMRTSTACLALLRPGGSLEPVVLCGLEEDPLAAASAENPSPALSLLESSGPSVQKRGEPGPLTEAIVRAGVDCVAAVSLPLRSPVRAHGLLVFLLPQEASLPNATFLAYLERAGLQLATALDTVSTTIASDRLERALREALLGRVSRHALRRAEESFAEVESAASRLRAHPDAPGWLNEGLLQIENSILKLKGVQQSFVGVASGLMPPKRPTNLEELLKEIERHVAGPLRESGIRLQLDCKPDLQPVRAEPFTLWGLLSHMIEEARRSLSGIPTGGVIRVLAQTAGEVGRVTVFDNAAALALQSPPSRYLAWPLDRRLLDIERALLEPGLNHLNAQVVTETRVGVGTIRTLTLPTA